MRNVNLKNNKFVLLTVSSLFCLIIGVIAFVFGTTGIKANADSIENLKDQAYLSAHYTDGTMGMILDESYNSIEYAEMRTNYSHLQKTIVRSSGLSDEQSIVAVFLGDGFTVGEQQDFLDRVEEITNYMVTVEPFNYYKNYLTVYAVHSISNESGVSGELAGTFACCDSSGNPTTDQCTPVDSDVFNCEHGRDTYYHSYYQWRSSANRVVLEMASSDRTRARNDALSACSSVDMIQIIANSGMRGGTGQMPTKTQPLGVALTSINYNNPNGDWKQVIMHEFGHAFGGLWDEYWNGITPSEYPNMTRNSDSSTVKWCQWIGYKNVGVYPFASTEWDGNPNQETDPWYRPHQNCIMRQTSNPYCPVCCQALLDKMEIKTGVALFNTEKSIFSITEINSAYVRIDKLNVVFNGAFNIPERFNEHIVIEIGSDAFANQTQLTSITLPSTITSIGEYAFEGCSNLTTVNIPTNSNLQSIGTLAFAGCEKLTNITLPSSLLSIGDSAFDGCSHLTTVNIPTNSHLQSIGYGAFAGCEKLTNITLSSSLLSIGEQAFADCSSLQSITIPTNLTGIGNGAFYGCDKLSTIYYNARDCININGASYVGAFTNPSGVSAVTVYIGDTVEKLPEDLFFQVEKLSSVILPNSIEELSFDAFCWGIHFKAYYEGTENDWANIVKPSWDNTFAYCIYFYADEQPTVDGNYWHYENNAIKQWKPVVTFMGVTANGENKTTDSTQLTLTFDKSPSDLTAADISVSGATKGALSGTGSTRTLEISNITVRNGGTVFVNVSPTDEYHIVGGSQSATVYVKLYNLVYYDVGGESFSGTHADGYPMDHNNGYVTHLKAPTKVGYEFLGWYTDSECSGTPITSLSEDAIYHSDIILYAKWEAAEFGYIANADKTEYTITIGAAGLTNMNVTLPSTYKGKPVTGIAERAFEESGITSIAIPSSVKEIGNRVFFGCANLTTVSFATNSQLISIGDYAFSGCSNLEAIQLPNLLESIGNIAFYNCTSLTNLTMGNRVTTIGSRAFHNCSALTSLDLSNTLTTIGNQAFVNCTGLQSIVIPWNVTTMGRRMFQRWTSDQTIYIEAATTPTGWNTEWLTNCSAQVMYSSGALEFTLSSNETEYEVSVAADRADEVTTLVIPATHEGLPVIVASYGFEGCENLRNVIISEGVTTIGYRAFAVCPNLQHINIPSSVMNFGGRIASGCMQLKSVTMSGEIYVIDFNAFDGAFGYTIYMDRGGVSEGDWMFLGSMSTFCYVVTGCTFSEDNTYVVSVVYDSNTVVYNQNYQPIDGYWIDPPYREGYIFAGWATTENGAGYLGEGVLLSGGIPEGTRLYATWEPIEESL